MGDLISRSEYKKKLEDYSKHLAVRYDKANEEGDFVEMERVNNECAAYRMLKLMLDDMPVAYDVEAVVKELDDESYWTESTFDEDGYSNDDSEEVVPLYKALEIVRKGGKEQTWQLEQI